MDKINVMPEGDLLSARILDFDAVVQGFFFSMMVEIYVFVRTKRVRFAHEPCRGILVAFGGYERLCHFAYCELTKSEALT